MAGPLSPLLWQGQPFGHREALLDFLSSHERWHYLLALKTGAPVELFDDLADALDRHNAHHSLLASGLNLSTPSDFSVYDLRQRDGWVLFMQLHSLEHERLRTAAGL